MTNLVTWQNALIFKERLMKNNVHFIIIIIIIIESMKRRASKPSHKVYWSRKSSHIKLPPCGVEETCAERIYLFQLEENDLAGPGQTFPTLIRHYFDPNLLKKTICYFLIDHWWWFCFHFCKKYQIYTNKQVISAKSWYFSRFLLNKQIHKYSYNAFLCPPPSPCFLLLALTLLY